MWREFLYEWRSAYIQTPTAHAQWNGMEIDVKEVKTAYTHKYMHSYIISSYIYIQHYAMKGSVWMEEIAHIQISIVHARKIIGMEIDVKMVLAIQTVYAWSYLNVFIAQLYVNMISAIMEVVACIQTQTAHVI